MSHTSRQRSSDHDDDDYDVRYANDGRGDVLADGEKLVVPLYAMDAAVDDLQRAVMRDAAERRLARRFGLNDGADLHRPGFRYNLSDEMYDAREAAYRDYENSQAEAWRSPPTGAGERSQRGQQPGDACSIDGRAGHLRLVNGELKCIPDGPVRGNDHAMTDREAAYAEYQDRIENAWRDRR
jgi:hypothetical protein